MHRFPQRPRFDACRIQCHTHRLDVRIRFAGRMERPSGMRYSGRPADCSLDSRLIGMFSCPFTLQGGIRDRIVFRANSCCRNDRRRVLMQARSPLTFRTAAPNVGPARMLVVGRMMRVGNRHLPTPDTRRKCSTSGNCTRSARAGNTDRPPGPAWRRT